MDNTACASYYYFIQIKFLHRPAPLGTPRFLLVYYYAQNHCAGFGHEM